jgi:hypothetical protein
MTKALAILALLMLSVVDRPAVAAERRGEPARVDINGATADELKTLPGIDDAYARKIIENRPYVGTADLDRKRVLPRPVYERIAVLIVAKPSGNASTTPRRTLGEADMPKLAAKQHPGQKWGYLTVYMNRGDTVGTLLVVKVPDTMENGALVNIPVSSGAMNARTHDLWTQVRGYVRRGQGKGGTDAFEVTGVWHRANPNLARRGNDEYASEGWRSMKETIALTH